jgi:hypothetical protein
LFALDLSAVTVAVDEHDRFVTDLLDQKNPGVLRVPSTLSNHPLLGQPVNHAPSLPGETHNGAPISGWSAEASPLRRPESAI